MMLILFLIVIESEFYFVLIRLISKFMYITDVIFDQTFLFASNDQPSNITSFMLLLDLFYILVSSG
jgi:hypothetical protein